MSETAQREQERRRSRRRAPSRRRLLNAMQHGAAALRTLAERAELRDYPGEAAFDRKQAEILEAALAAPAAPEAPWIEQARAAVVKPYPSRDVLVHFLRLALGMPSQIGAAPEAPLSVEPDGWQVQRKSEDGWYPVSAALTREDLHGSPGYRQLPLYLHPPVARQPGADAVLVKRLRGHARRLRTWIGNNPTERIGSALASVANDAEAAAAAIARLSAPAGPGSEGGEVEHEVWRDEVSGRFVKCAGCGYKWNRPHEIECRSCGADGIASAALEASGADHHDAGTGEPC